MFGLSWTQIGIIVVVGVFLLGPERIPTAVSWVTSTLRKVRGMAVGAQAELRKEIGPEMEELRRQIAELQSLKEIQELRDLRDLHPKRIIGRNLMGDEFSGGVSGFLGLKDPPGGGTPDRTVGSTSGRDGAVKPVSAVPTAAPTGPVEAPATAAPATPSAGPAAVPVTASAAAGPVGSATAGGAEPTARPVPPFDPDGT